MTITTLPTPPSRSDDPTTFSDKADALLGALPTFVTEANALATDVSSKQSTASSAASSASSSASSASSSAGSAASSASAAASSASQAENYVASMPAGAINDSIQSPTNTWSSDKINAVSVTLTGTQTMTNKTLESPKVTGVSTGLIKVDSGTGVLSPATAGTDYQAPLVSGTSIKTLNGASLLGSGDISVSATVQYMFVREEQASGTTSGVSFGGGNTITNAVLNTTVINTISGASLSSNQITLPAGTYDVNGVIPFAIGLGQMAIGRAQIIDSSNVVLLSGPNEYDVAPNIHNNSSYGSGQYAIAGRFVLATTKTFNLSAFNLSNGVSSARPVSQNTPTSLPEYYSTLEIRKVA